MSFVYWIHLDSHLDITTDGYVGVANDFEGRMKRHAAHTAKDSTHFARAVRLHGWLNLVKEVIYQGARAECMRTEQLLRHSYQIGWNEAIGGHGGGHISTSPAYKNRAFHGWSYDKNGARNPFYNKTFFKNQGKLLIFTQPIKDFYIEDQLTSDSITIAECALFLQQDTNKTNFFNEKF
jgi:predicted GIY-YIG superfamily endonuclease